MMFIKPNPPRMWGFAICLSPISKDFCYFIGKTQPGHIFSPSTTFIKKDHIFTFCTENMSLMLHIVFVQERTIFSETFWRKKRHFLTFMCFLRSRIPSPEEPLSLTTVGGTSLPVAATSTRINNYPKANRFSSYFPNSLLFFIWICPPPPPETALF